MADKELLSEQLRKWAERLGVWMEDPQEMADSIADEVVVIFERSIATEDKPIPQDLIDCTRVAATAAFYVMCKRMFVDFMDEKDEDLED